MTTSYSWVSFSQANWARLLIFVRSGLRWCPSSALLSDHWTRCLRQLSNYRRLFASEGCLFIRSEEGLDRAAYIRVTGRERWRWPVWHPPHTRTSICTRNSTHSPNSKMFYPRHAYLTFQGVEYHGYYDPDRSTVRDIFELWMYLLRGAFPPFFIGFLFVMYLLYTCPVSSNRVVTVSRWAVLYVKGNYLRRPVLNLQRTRRSRRYGNRFGTSKHPFTSLLPSSGPDWTHRWKL